MHRNTSDAGNTYPPPIKSYKNNGFTLIELSIVLVIIGLIIGGILVGRDLVKAAEQRAQIAQIEKYNTAVNAFYGKYNGIAGDLNSIAAASFGFTVGASCSGVRGARDGNGIIEGFLAYNNVYPEVQYGETGLFWQDLSTAGYVDGKFPGPSGAPIACVAGSSVSQTSISSYFPAGKLANSSVYIFSSNGVNYFGLSTVWDLDGNGTINNSGLSGAPNNIAVIQAYNIDKKIDDGLATTGSVQAQYVDFPSNNYTQTQAPNANPDTASTCYNSVTGAYSIGVNSGTNPTCGLSFKMISP